MVGYGREMRVSGTLGAPKRTETGAFATFWTGLWTGLGLPPSSRMDRRCTCNPTRSPHGASSMRRRRCPTARMGMPSEEPSAGSRPPARPCWSSVVVPVATQPRQVLAATFTGRTTCTYAVPGFPRIAPSASRASSCCCRAGSSAPAEGRANPRIALDPARCAPRQRTERGPPQQC